MPLTVPATYVNLPDAVFTVESDAYGDSYTMSLSVEGHVVARGSGFRPGASQDFSDDAFTAGTFGAFLAHALESSEPDAREGWEVLEDAIASDYVDSLQMMGEDTGA